MLAQLMIAAHLERVMVWQLAPQGQRTGQATYQFQAELQKFKSPFFESIP